MDAPALRARLARLPTRPAPLDSDDASALCAQLQQELDRYHSGGKDLGGTFREVEPAAVRVGDRIRILDITLYYRQWTEFIVHRIERYPGQKGFVISFPGTTGCASSSMRWGRTNPI